MLVITDWKNRVFLMRDTGGMAQRISTLGKDPAGETACSPPMDKSPGTEGSFQERVLQACAEIPLGYYTTYQAIAHELGTSPRAGKGPDKQECRYAAKRSCLVGQALKRNDRAPIVPCHRVLCSSRSLGGYHGSLAANVAKKRRLLEQEGLSFDEKGKLAPEHWTKMYNFGRDSASKKVDNLL